MFFPCFDSKLLMAQVHATGMAALLSLRLGEAGAGLSLGQQQQLCLARLLMRRPRIVVLDEATAHVDAGAAAAIHALVAEKFADCTVLSIAVGHSKQTLCQPSSHCTLLACFSYCMRCL